MCSRKAPCGRRKARIVGCGNFGAEGLDMWFHGHQECVLAGTKEKCSASGDPCETASTDNPVGDRAAWNNVGGRGCFVWFEESHQRIGLVTAINA